MTDILRAAGGISSSTLLLQQREKQLGISRNAALQASNTMAIKADNNGVNIFTKLDNKGNSDLKKSRGNS